MTTDPKPLTREELLNILPAATTFIGLSRAVAALARTVAAMLPAEGAKLEARIAHDPTMNWPDPTPEQLASPLFDVIWQTIKTWDINVPDAYRGYESATGNHVRAIMDALTREPPRMVTHHCPDCAHHVQERDAAIARAEKAGAEAERLHLVLEQSTDKHLALEARADAAEKRVAELEECHHIVEGYSQKVYAAGIREGLERAAVRVGDPNTRQTWLEPRFATALAKELRAMKEQVK